ncbi:hypothetical protein SFUMM280S_07589 [Streptomyces fumanus]
MGRGLQGGSERMGSWCCAAGRAPGGACRRVSRVVPAGGFCGQRGGAGARGARGAAGGRLVPLGGGVLAGSGVRAAWRREYSPPWSGDRATGTPARRGGAGHGGWRRRPRGAGREPFQPCCLGHGGGRKVTGGPGPCGPVRGRGGVPLGHLAAGGAPAGIVRAARWPTPGASAGWSSMFTGVVAQQRRRQRVEPRADVRRTSSRSMPTIIRWTRGGRRLRPASCTSPGLVAPARVGRSRAGSSGRPTPIGGAGRAVSNSGGGASAATDARRHCTRSACWVSRERTSATPAAPAAGGVASTPLRTSGGQLPAPAPAGSMTCTVNSPAGWTASSRAACATAASRARPRSSCASPKEPSSEGARPLSIHRPRSSGSRNSIGMRTPSASGRWRSPRRTAMGISIGTR